MRSRADALSPAMRAMRHARNQLETEAGRLRGLDFVPRPSDIFIVTSPKAGTTWLQQIVHSLRGGTQDFSEICEVIPCIELAHDCGINLAAPQACGLRRCYKTHAWETDCPKGARYIVCMREPKDSAVSFFHFFEGWLFEKGSISLDEFVADFVLARGRPSSRLENASWWEHLLSWWPRRHDDDVCLLFFEDLKASLPEQIRRLAAFLGGDATAAERLAEAERVSSFSYMKAHEEQFNESLTKRARNRAMGLPPDAGLGAGEGKVREGKTGAAHEELSPETRNAIDRRWAAVEQATGYASFAALRDGFARERATRCERGGDDHPARARPFPVLRALLRADT